MCISPMLRKAIIIAFSTALVTACGTSDRRNVATTRGSSIAPADPATQSLKTKPSRAGGFWYRQAGPKPSGPFRITEQQPVSTFSADVDTASYAVVRKSLLADEVRPAPGMVRTEEMINYFSYAYPKPRSEADPLRPTIHVFPTPWNSRTHLIHIAVQAYEPPRNERPAANIVLLMDLSASVRDDDKLPLMKESVALLTSALDTGDHIAIVGYNREAAIILPPTSAATKSTVLERIGDNLRPKGRTDLGKGLLLAYQQAQKHYAPEKINRVILLTDGDVTRGARDPYYLRRAVARQRRKGISLSVLGYGLRKYNDRLLQTLAQSGNGAAAFIDGTAEARRVLVDGLATSLSPVAEDVKLQVEFNPAKVSQYRLIGYESRRIAPTEFSNDRSDAGDVAAGQSVTAIYEVTLAEPGTTFYDNRLRYKKLTPAEMESRPKALFPDEIGTLTLRYKRPTQKKSNILTRTIYEGDTVDSIATLPAEIRFSTAVAAFGQYLRRDELIGDYDLIDILEDAGRAVGRGQEAPLRNEFLSLVRATMKVEKVYVGF